MARIFDNNVANYMSRASVNLGLNGLTECSYAFSLKIFGLTGVSQRILDKDNVTLSGLPLRATWTQSTLTLNFTVANIDLTQTPSWRWPIPPYGTSYFTRVLFGFKRNAIDVTDAVCYYDGTLQTGGLLTAGGYVAGFVLGEASGTLYYGLRSLTLDLPLNAALARVNVWNRQLTAQEAVDDFLNPMAVRSGLVHQSNGNLDVDESANANHLSVTGALAITENPTMVHHRIHDPQFVNLITA